MNECDLDGCGNQQDRQEGSVETVGKRGECEEGEERGETLRDRNAGFRQQSSQRTSGIA